MGHDFDLDAVAHPKITRATYQQRQWPFTMMNEVDARLHAGYDAIIVQHNIDIFDRTLFYLPATSRVEQIAKLHPHMVIWRNKSPQVCPPSWTGQQTGQRQVKVGMIGLFNLL